MRQEELFVQYSIYGSADEKTLVAVEIVFNIPKGRTHLVMLKVNFTYLVLYVLVCMNLRRGWGLSHMYVVN